MHLLIVESPAKARTIGRYVGDEYVVKASVGHVRDLPKSNKDAVDIEGGFVPRYEVAKGKEVVVQELIELAQRADDVILATDPDREGEAIAWHLSEAAGLDDPKRIVFHEITEEAVKEALSHPRKIDMHLKTAQEARRVLDRLFGYELSGLIWKKVRYGLSAGRVQSPALRILAEREREIQKFEPVTYWTISAQTKTGSDEVLALTCTEEPTDEKRVKDILVRAKRAAWSVRDIEEKEASRAARPPFTTSTLQQTASTRLGFSPSRTMRAAQKLYEAGHITYMRTDSTAIAKAAQSQLVATATSEFGADHAQAQTYKTKSKSAQEAHEAVRPTKPGKQTAGRTDDEKKLYDLIRRRAIASQMKAAKLKRTKITVLASDGKIELPEFSVNGSRVIFDGWLAADPAARGEDTQVPKVEAGEALSLVSIESEEKQTQPPSRYTEAGLVKELEKRGIGRPSTYASIMQTIQDRGYVEKEGRTLTPTDLGMVISTFLEAHFANYISDSFTAEMENELDEIAEGARGYEETLSDFYTPFHEAVESKQDIEKLTTLGDAPAEFTCPKCGASMVYKLSKSGTFMSCSRFPECDGMRTKEGEELEGPKSTGRTCPKCEKAELIERDGRYGRFIACGNYPKCKYVEEDPAQKEKMKTGVACPECKTAGRDGGEIIERRGRYGAFFSCDNYPDCKYALKARPTGNLCPECGKLMMEGTKTIPERCSDKQCPYHNPHKLEKTKK